MESLPSWERGLKYSNALYSDDLPWSLPSWERGLKLLLLGRKYKALQSLPSWERGLKCLSQKKLQKMHSRSLRGSVD